MELQGYGATGAGPQRPLPPPSAESSAAAPADPERGKLLPGGAALPSGPLSVAAATVVVCKALLGVTLFETPWAAANAGVLLTPLWLVLISMACLYTAQMLVTVRRTAALAALDEGPLPAMDSLPALVDCCLGATAAVVTELAVLVASFGLLTVYLARRSPGSGLTRSRPRPGVRRERAAAAAARLPHLLAHDMGADAASGRALRGAESGALGADGWRRAVCGRTGRRRPLRRLRLRARARRLSRAARSLRRRVG